MIIATFSDQGVTRKYGLTVDAVVRAVYGKHATARKSADPDSPVWGDVLGPVMLDRKRHVIATIVEVTAA